MPPRTPDDLAASGAIREELIGRFRAGADAPLPDADFDRLARAIFRHQFEHVPALRAYWRRREATPDTIGDWREIPAVPTAAFKEVPLVAGGPEAAARVFRTSGTTRGRERRGAHHVRDLELYHASLLATFRAFLLPDGAAPLPLSLMPSAAELPDSSLAEMISVVMDALGGGRSFAGAASGLDQRALAASLGEAIEAERPVALLGTSLAFVRWLDGMRERGESYRLPAGSRLMDTGGYKGSERRVEEPELRRLYAERLGLPASHCVNEYGMTELLSQCYDTALRDAVRGEDARGAAVSGTADGAGPAHRRKAGPPWLRTRVVDPETLRPLPPGETGILQHFDLANLHSALAVQTEDLGVEVRGGFVLLGRATGAPPRGCSIAMDLLLRAQEGSRA